MSKLWQRFVTTFGEAEMAAIALLIAGIAVTGSLALLVHWIKLGHYCASLGLVTAMVVTGVNCVRDFRRGRWSVLSGALIIVWFLLVGFGLVFGIWTGAKQN